MRRCRRCGELFFATGKDSKICPDCYLPKGGYTKENESYWKTWCEKNDIDDPNKSYRSMTNAKQPKTSNRKPEK